MKKLILAVLVIYGILFYLHNENKVVKSTETAVATDTAQPQEVIVPTTRSAPPVAEKHYAPDGVFYLTQRVSFSDETGIVGVNPGTQVKWLSNNLTGAVVTGFHVTDGSQAFDVTTTQVTNDLAVAAAVISMERSKQDALAAEQRRLADIRATTVPDQSSAQPTPTDMPVSTPPPAAVDPGAPASSLNQGAYGKHVKPTGKGQFSY